MSAYVADRVVKFQENLTVMPDVVVTCEHADQGDAFFLEAPGLVMEVLSKSTQARDRTYTLLLYQAKETIQEIVFISQRIQHIEVISRENTGWTYREYGAGEAFLLKHLNITLQVTDIYHRLAIPIETRRLLSLEVRKPEDDEPEGMQFHYHECQRGLASRRPAFRILLRIDPSATAFYSGSGTPTQIFQYLSSDRQACYPGAANAFPDMDPFSPTSLQ